jgi:hypothetical protein
MTSRVAAIVFRLVFALGAVVAMAFQLFAIHLPRGYNGVNFFSYFTNLSNLFISVVFIVSAARLIAARAPSPTDTAIRGAAVVYIAFVGLVFNTLLRGADLSAIDPTVNVILHYVLPIAGLVDWLVWPPRNRMPFVVTLWWMIFPAAYAVFSVVRGAIDGIYPYPFFNPDAVGGYGAVGLYCGVMVIAFFVLAVAVWAVGNARAPRPARATDSAAVWSHHDD